MKKTKLLLTLLCLCLGTISTLAQSVTIIKEMQKNPYANVLVMYKNDFGSFEKPDMSITFPYALIRMQLQGNAYEVKAAKERLTLDMGQLTGVEARVTTYSNQILFLLRAPRHPMIYIDGGDGCDQVLLSNMQQLQPNCLYDCTVRFTLERDRNITTDTIFVNQGPQLHKLRLQVDPAYAKIDVIAHGERKDWILTNGIADLQLAEGDYQYTITAEDYHTAEGVIHIPTNQTDTIIRLRPTFGWMRISSDSMDLQGLSALISHQENKEIKLLPMEQIAYYPGDYTISIEKEKHHPYKKSITIEEGKLTTVCPVLVPKAYKHNTFLLTEAGFAINPSWGVGLMVGQVYGEVRSSYGIGWYVQGRSNFQMVKAIPNTLVDKYGMIEGKIPFYTGEQRTNELIIDAGLVLNFLNKQKPNRNKRSMFGVYAGLGYGQYARSWEISDGRWIEYAPSKAKGLSFGGGLIGSIKGFTINAGINTIQARYVEVEAGLGWTF